LRLMLSPPVRDGSKYKERPVMGNNEAQHPLPDCAISSSDFLSFWTANASGGLALRASYAELSKAVTEVLPLGGFQPFARLPAWQAAGWANSRPCPGYSLFWMSRANTPNKSSG
jgi:hypothetical protein